MSADRTSALHPEPSGSTCLTRAVAAVLESEPTLEAVTIDPAHQKISVATLGRADEARLRERINATLHALEQPDSGHACELLVSGGSCANCTTPWSEPERNQFTVRHDHGAIVDR